MNELIPTGCLGLDKILRGGVHPGLLTDFYGPPGSGKSQICFSLSAQCAARGETTMFVDTTGTFRPERIAEMGGSDAVLGNVKVIRARSLADQLKIIDLISEINPSLVVIDSLTALFSQEVPGAPRHLMLMRHLRDLAYAAIRGDYHIVFTNMVRARMQDTDHNSPFSQKVTQDLETTREFLGSSASLYAHVKVKLEIVGQERLLFKATAVIPPAGSALGRVGAQGIEDVL